MGRRIVVLILNMLALLLIMLTQMLCSKGVWHLPQPISSDQLIDPQMSLDPQFLVPIKDSVGSDPTTSTHLSSKYNDTSLVLPSIEDNSDSLIKTEEFLEFVDELSQEPSPFSDRKGTSNHDDTVPSVKAEESSHSKNVVDKTSESVNSSIESQDVSIDEVLTR